MNEQNNIQKIKIDIDPSGENRNFVVQQYREAKMQGFQMIDHAQSFVVMVKLPNGIITGSMILTEEDRDLAVLVKYLMEKQINTYDNETKGKQENG